MQQNKIYSFCPEATFIDFKQNGECRIFHNDCAVLDAGNGFRVIAERGFPGAIGASFADVLDLTPKARKKLNEFLLCEPSVLLLPNGDSSVFFFSDWYFSTGLLLAVRLSQKESVLRKIINNNARSSGFSLFPASDPLESSPASTAAETVNELFYYAQRIFSQELTCTPLTQAHLLANLAGCRLEQLDLPYDPPFHTKLQRDRFSAFLLCVFL
ncbi:MAG: hypothetical protein IJX13_05265, partial [Clostridia bacterium]|nr:hypothetical protein [Clostridia bacterium]